MMALNKWIIIFSILPFLAAGQVQDTAYRINKKRLQTFTITASASYGLTLVALHQLWYKNSPTQSFTFFNDSAEWKQVDKLGHFYSAFYFSYGTARALQWCNVRPTQSDLLGALIGFGVLLPIEIFDGFSTAYGASTGDLMANATGASFYFLQAKLWREVRIQPKFSFHQTPFAPLRPAVLGTSLPSELFKDYNGQTYWLCFDMDKFIPFPRWLNLAIGYGAQGMVYARNEPNTEAGFTSYRQYYVSLDLDFMAFKGKSKALNTVLFIASMIKFPLPTVEFTPQRITFHAAYF